MRRGLLCAVALAWAVAVATPGAVVAAVLQGQPLIQQFGPDDYAADPANYDVLALPDGSMLFGNSAGLLSFDGAQWDLLELPGQSPARSLFLGRDDRLYVGGYDQLGRVETDSSGQRSYIDMRGEFGEAGSRADFDYIWEIIGNSRGVIYRSDSRLFFAGYDGERKVWPVEVDLRRMFSVGDQFYARVHGVGFCRLEDGKFILEPGGEVFANRTLPAVFTRGDSRVLISEDGFFLADRDGIRKAPSVDHAALYEAGPNSAVRLPDGSLVVGGDGGHLLHFNADLKLVGANSLGAYSVLDLGLDREGGLWAATENNLMRMRFPSPWSSFTADNGWVGSALSTAFHDGSLWVATSSGVYRGRVEQGRARFDLAVETSLEASSMLDDERGLLIGDRDSIKFRPIDGSPVVQVLSSDSVFLLQRSKFEAGVVFALSDVEVIRLRWQAGAWQVLSRWPLEGISTGSLIEVAAGRFWLDNFRGGPQRWDYDPAGGELQRKVEFKEQDGLRILPDYGTGLLRLDNEIYAISGALVFRLQGERFVEEHGEPFSLIDNRYYLSFAETDFGDFAFTPQQVYRRLPGTQDWQVMHLGAPLTRGFRSMRVDADGVLRVVTWGGLLQFDPSVAEAPLAPLQVELTGFQRRGAEGMIERIPLKPNQSLAMASDESLVFDYRMVSMDPGIEFRFMVEGLTAGWSDWSTPGSPALTMRKPDPGNYTLVVEGRTRTGRVGEPLRFAFSVAPAWWETNQARVLAVFTAMLLLLGAVHLFVRFRYRQYLAINRKLEAKIAERTSELEFANRKLAELATEDSLTGVANRRALEQGLNREWERCGELGQPLAVIMVDVDHFKQFNDRYGHLEGDQQLIRVAHELSGRVRPVRELLARFGGEEFAVVLPGTTLEEALARAETMRAAFDRDSFATTVSVGVAAEVPTVNRTPIDLLRDADGALYAAKRAGRNRVMRAAA